MTELYVTTGFLTEECYIDEVIKLEIEKDLRRAIPIGSTVKQIVWRPLLHLDGSDTQWQAVLIYE